MLSSALQQCKLGIFTALGYSATLGPLAGTIGLIASPTFPYNHFTYGRLFWRVKLSNGIRLNITMLFTYSKPVTIGYPIRFVELKGIMKQRNYCQSRDREVIGKN